MRVSSMPPPEAQAHDDGGSDGAVAEASAGRRRALSLYVARDAASPVMQAQTSSPLVDAHGAGLWGTSWSLPGAPELPMDETHERLAELVAAMHACEQFAEMLVLAHDVHRLLLEGGGVGRVYEGFGAAGGFLVVGQLLAAVQRSAATPSDAAAAAAVQRSQLLLDALTLLSDAISYSRANLVAFERTFGWDALTASLEQAVAAGGAKQPSRVAALLMGLGVAHVAEGARQFSDAYEARRIARDAPVRTWRHRVVVHPSAVNCAVRVVHSAHGDGALAATAYDLLDDLLRASARNVTVLSRTPLVSRLLHAWLAGAESLEPLLRRLLADGMRHSADVHDVFAFLVQAPTLDAHNRKLDLLYDVAVAAHRPAALTLDTRDAWAGLRLDALPAPFPPEHEAASGYTLALVLRLDDVRGDAAAGTLLDLVCIGESVCLALDLRTRTLVYVFGGPIALPRATLRLGRVHHVVLTHARAAPGALSPMHVYLDGQPACTVQAPWPAALPTPAAVRIGGVPPRSAEPRAVEATWSWSATWLHASVVPSSVLPLLAELVPLYAGSVQGPLARFLTYAGVARMQARLDALIESAAGQVTPAHQALYQALYSAAADLFPLERFYFHLEAAHTLRSGHAVLVPNQAEAHVSDALRAHLGHATVHGVPTVTVPHMLDGAVWSIGGCAVLLRLVERADTSAALACALRLCLRLVSSSWRLAEDAERMQAFGVLGVLLRDKAALLTLPVLAMLVDAAAPGGVLANAPLYRAVLLDTTLWAQAPRAVQSAYMAHFVAVLPRSGRALAKVHTVRRLVWFARAADVPPAAVARAARAALEGQFSARNVQALVLFVASTLGAAAPHAALLGGAAPADDTQRRRPVECPAARIAPCVPRDARRIATARALLDVFVDMLAQHATLLAVAAEAAPVKWVLVLLRPGLDRDTAPAAIELLGLLLSASPVFAQKLARLGGFRVLERTLPPLWDVPCVLPWLWTLLLAEARPTRASLYATFKPGRRCGAGTGNHAPLIRYAGVVPILVACLAAGLRRLAPLHDRRARRASVPASPAAAARDAQPYALLADSVALLAAYADAPALGDLLLLAPTLTSVLRGAVPLFCDEPCAPSVARLCDELLDTVARCLAESMLASHTLSLMHHVHAAMPTPDPLVQSRLCAAVYTRVLTHVDRLVRTRRVSRRTLDLLADLIELASNESVRAAPLQACLFSLGGIVAEAPVSLLSPRCRAQAHLALERNVLHALVCAAARRPAAPALAFAAHHARFLLGPEAESLFLQCVVHAAVVSATQCDESTHRAAAADSLQYICDTHAWVARDGQLDDILPRLAAADVADLPRPFAGAWATVVADQDTFVRSLYYGRLRALHASTGHCTPYADSVLAVHERLGAWHAALEEADAVRLARHAQDVREDVSYMRRLWAEARALLRLAPRRASWALDPTEGPHRVRTRLCAAPEPGAMALQPLTGPVVSDVPEAGAEDAKPLSDAVLALLAGDGGGLAAAAPVAPAAEAPAPAPPAPPVDYEDKYRCVLRALEAGDAIEDVLNTSRVVGIDAQGSLLVAGTRRLYLLDDLFQRPSGEIVSVDEAPAEERDALILAAGVAGIGSASGTPVRSWRWSHIEQCFERAWLHRRTAMELFFSDGQSCLLVLASRALHQRLRELVRLKAPAALAASDALVGGTREPRALPPALANTRLSDVLRRGPARETLAWQERRLSNAAYLMALNTVAGRTHNDFTQYPVFPWVLAQYDADELDLAAPDTFRALDRPMGAQTAERAAEFTERYAQLEQVQMEPFHYGTHYSTAATVCGFLVRVRPFAETLVALQGGSFDLADRLFSSLGAAWASASARSCADVRELTPEFFFLPEMFVNMNAFEFGRTQSGARVDDVALPPWAHGDPVLFVQRHREALESEHVSAHLHTWIDLIFGCRARGDAAVAALNVFHPLSYADNVDVEEIDAPLERQAAAQVIHNFGQTPTQLFARPHPPRHPHSTRPPWAADADLLDYADLLVPSRAPSVTTAAPIYHLGGAPGAPRASTRECLELHDDLRLSYGYVDGSVRFTRAGAGGDARPIAMLEQAALGRLTCMCTASDLVVFGSDDGMVQLYTLHEHEPRLEAAAALPGHAAAVACAAASTAWSTAITGGLDASVCVWDLNRHRLVRTLHGPDMPITHVAIDEARGWLAATAGTEVFVWTINGALLVRQSTRSAASEPPASLVFLARDYHVGRLAVLVTGHRGCAVIWDVVSNHAARAAPPRWRLERRVRLSVRPDALAPPRLTALHAASQAVLCAGDEHGRVHTWALPGAQPPAPPTDRCMHTACGRKFKLFETRRTCVACGGTFCSACATVFTAGQVRLCVECIEVLGGRMPL